MKLFSRHYGTERFFIMIAVCFAALVALSIYGSVVQHQIDSAYISDNAIYTRTYTWSRTGSEGEVVGMFTDTSRSAVFVLLKNDSATTSTSASSYQVYMKGRDEKLQNNPVLTVFVYGPTGYVGLYFKDSAGFRNQVYSLIIRNDSAASDNANENTFDPNMERDASFRDHNQIRLYLNFGAAGAEVAPIMDVPNVTPLQLFMDMPAQVGTNGGASGKFDKACNEAQSMLSEMSQAYSQMNQYAENLKDNGVVVPELPYYIAADRIDTIPNDFSSEPMRFEPIMATSTGTAGNVEDLYFDTKPVGADDVTDGSDGAGNDALVGSVAGEGATYVDSEGKEHKYYYLHTDYLYPGMVHFAWQGKAFSSGFVTHIGAFGSNGASSTDMYNAYKTWRETSATGYANALPTSVKYDAWRYADGSFVDMSSAGAGDGISNIVPDLCNSYSAAVNKYLSLKQQYGDKMAEMLDAENEIQMLTNVMSSNDGKAVKNLWLY